MTEAEDNLVTAAIENWVTGKFTPLIKAVLEEREQTVAGDVLIRMPAEDWRKLTDYVSRVTGAQALSPPVWAICAKIESELPQKMPATNICPRDFKGDC